MEKLKQTIDDEMKHLIAKYRNAQKVPVSIILTTRANYNITLVSPMTWYEMKLVHDRGFLGSTRLSVCDEILSPDSYKEISKFDLENGEILVVRNSQIIGMIIDKEKIMANINGFVNELLEAADKYNLSGDEIDYYLNSQIEWQKGKYKNEQR